MTKPNLEELKAQAIRHRQSGDSYTAIGNYLTSSGASTDEIKEIIAHLDKLEKVKAVQPKKTQRGTSLTSGFIEVFLITFGGTLSYFLWGNGLNF